MPYLYRSKALARHQRVLALHAVRARDWKRGTDHFHATKVVELNVCHPSDPGMGEDGWHSKRNHDQVHLFASNRARELGALRAQLVLRNAHDFGEYFIVAKPSIFFALVPLYTCFSMAPLGQLDTR